MIETETVTPNADNARRILAMMERAQALEHTAQETDLPSDVTIEEPEGQTTPDALATIRLRTLETKLKNRKQVIKLRKKLANYAIWIVIIQLGLANLFFGAYLWHNAKDPDSGIMIAWLSATVVEVIGILWVIARSLFPYKDKGFSGSEKGSSRVHA